MFSVILTAVVGGLTFFAALPSTPTYQLNSYGFGSGGTSNSTTGNYALEGITGEISGSPGSTTTYQLKPGFVQTQQAHVPTVTLSNTASASSLKFVIGQQNNPSDALYALQVCVGGGFPCGSTTYYVKNDNTLTTTLTTADYQDYATWGGASGTNIIGLTASTTYYIEAKATQGKFTESDYGPSSNATTSAGGQTISFCVYTTDGNCSSSSHSLAFGSLLPATVTNSPYNIGVDFDTNAGLGGQVYIYGSNSGLKSTVAPGNYTITSTTADLGSASEGFGARVASSGQSSGGPFNPVSPYDNTTGDNIGGVGTSISTILSSGSSVTSGTAQILLKAKSSSATPSASDYSNLLTVIAAANF